MISYIITDKVQETASTVSFYLKPADNSAVETFFPGQFITVRLGELKRNYTLSDSPDKSYYRITVKGEEGGAMSHALHRLEKEQTLYASRKPTGSFYLAPDNNKRLVLLSAGVGLTPMISILNHLFSQNDLREVWFIHSTKAPETLIMADYLKVLQREVNSLRVKIFFTAAGADGVGRGFSGRITPQLLQEILGSLDFSFFICGPAAFIRTFTQHLGAGGVPAEDVQYELFASTNGNASAGLEQRKTKVTFALTGLHFEWDFKDETLLEFSERNGISIPSSCRTGSCLTCETKLIDGAVRYLNEPFVAVRENHFLPCSAVPDSDISIGF
jgi:hypothetical protein